MCIGARPSDTAALKRPGSKLLVISTAGQGADSPLGRLRARALGQPEVRSRGAFTDARGPTLHLLEWAVPEDADADDPRVVKRANPASWITSTSLADQRESVTDLAFRRFHANQWTAKIGAWLPAGAWQDCAGKTEFTSGERVWIGVDVGGDRADSAVVWVNENLHVGVETWSGGDAVLVVAAFVASSPSASRSSRPSTTPGAPARWPSSGGNAGSWPAPSRRAIRE